MSLFLPTHLRTVSGSRKAPSWFTDRLHDIDPNLDIFFNMQRQRWIIFRTASGTQTHVKTLEQGNGEYKPPDEATLDWLRKADMWASGKTAEQLAADMDYEEARQKERIAQSIKADFHDAAIDDKLQIKRAVGDATVFPSPNQPSDSAPTDATGGNEA